LRTANGIILSKEDYHDTCWLSRPKDEFFGSISNLFQYIFTLAEGLHGSFYMSGIAASMDLWKKQTVQYTKTRRLPEVESCGGRS